MFLALLNSLIIAQSTHIFNLSASDKENVKNYKATCPNIKFNLKKRTASLFGAVLMKSKLSDKLGVNTQYLFYL